MDDATRAWEARQALGRWGLIAAVAAGGEAGVCLLWRQDAGVVQENRLVEWAQACLLLMACAAHAVWALRCRHAAGALVGAGLALFCLSLAVREVDVGRLGHSEAWTVVEGTLRGGVVLAWVVLGGAVARRLSAVWGQGWAGKRSICGVLTVAGCVLYAVSWPFDKMVFPLREETAMLVEETVQLNATFLLFVGGVAASERQDQRGRLAPMRCQGSTAAPRAGRRRGFDPEFSSFC